jgi:hypothetical protein
LVADDKERLMFIHCPGRTKLRQNQRSSTMGWSEITSLMLAVPAIMVSWPGSREPMPMAQASTS